MKAPFQLEGQVPPSIIAFCQENVDQIQSTIDAGAEKAGGIELIKACQVADSKYKLPCTNFHLEIVITEV